MTWAILIGFAVSLSSASAFAQDPGNTPDEKAFYAIGANMSKRLQQLNPISDREMNLLIQGIRDGVAGKQASTNPNVASRQIQKLYRARQDAAMEREKLVAEEFLLAEGKKKGAVTSESGLIYTEIKAGSGASPQATDKVKVHYHGTLRDGTVFDSSVDRGMPAEFPLNRVIPCWTEGVAKMKPGGKSRLICPAKIAYGNRGQGAIPPGAALIFEVELIEIVQ